MKSSVNKFSKGLINDLNPINQPNQSYQDSMGGNLIYNADGNYDWVVSNGNQFSFNIIPDSGSTTNKYTPIGGVGNSNIKILFSVDEVTGDSEIGIFAMNSDGIGSYKTLYNDISDPLTPNVQSLAFQANNQIEARFLYENDDLIRIYWCDGVKSDSNPPRVFTFKYDPLIGSEDDVTAYSALTTTAHSMNIQAEHNPGIIKYQEQIAGSLLSGVYQYTYRLITLDGYATPWVTPTRRYFVTTDAVNNTNWNLYEMEVSGISSPHGNRIEIKGIDTRYDKIEVAFLYSQTDLQIDESTIFFKGNIVKTNPTDSMFIDHVSMNGTPVIADTIATQFQGIKAAKTLDIKDSLIYFGNIVENLSTITDAEAEAIVGSVEFTPVFKDMRSDEQNYANTTTPILTQQTPKTGTTVRQLHNAVGGTETYQIVNDYVNYKGTQIDNMYSGYFRGETYRFALQLFDNLGFPVFAIHLGDLKLPEQTSLAYSWGRLRQDGTLATVQNRNLTVYPWPTNNFNDPSLTSSKLWAEDLNPAYNQLTGISYLRVMGINIDNIDISGVADRISGFSIVRVDRDATILAQGLAMPTMRDQDGNGDPIARPFAGCTQRWYNNAGSLDPTTLLANVQNVDTQSYQTSNDFHLEGNLTSFYAPDYDFDQSFIPVIQSQDVLRIVGSCFSDTSPIGTSPNFDVNAGAWFTYYEGSTAALPTISNGGLHSISKFYNSKNNAHFGTDDPTPRYLTEASLEESIFMNYDTVKADYVVGTDLHNSIHQEEGEFQGYYAATSGQNEGLRGASKDLIYYRHASFVPKTSAGVADNWSPIFQQSYFNLDAPSGNKNNYHLGSLIANYVRVNASPYGGVSQSSLEQSVFYSTGHFQPVNNSNFLTPVSGQFDGIEVFGGDCYLDYHAFMRNYPRYYDTDANHRECADGVVFPLESTLNQVLRQAPSVGDPQYANIGALPKEQYLGNKITFFTDGLYTARGISVAGQPDQFLEEFNLNAALLQREILKFFFTKPVDFNLNDKYPVRWRYPQNKFYGETLDSWRQFFALDYDDINGSYGEITSSSYLFNQIYSFQESAFGRLRAFDRAILDSTAGALTTGVGGKLDGIDYISTKYGNQHQFSMTNSGKALYWIDVDKRKAVRFAGDGKQSISDIRGLHEFFKDELGNYYNQDSPAGGYGIAVGYDFRNNHVFWTFVRDYHRALGANIFVDSVDINNADYYANNSTIFVNGGGGDVIFPETTFGTGENDSVVYYVANEVGGSPVTLQTAVASPPSSTVIGTVNAGEYYEVTRENSTGVWSAVQVTLADITPFKATICYNEDLDAFTGFFGFRPTYYISHKDTIITHDKLFPAILNKMYVHEFNPLKANYYGQNYKSYISVSNKEDEFSSKIFDSIRVNFNEQGNDDITRYIFRTEGQVNYYDVQTDSRKRYLEDSLRMPTRTFNQSDRTRGKWINYIFEYKNNSNIPVKLFNLITNYRISNRM